MSKVIFALFTLLSGVSAVAATAAKVAFTLGTTTKTGTATTESRYYYVYRPDGLVLTAPVPAIMVLEDVAGDPAVDEFNALANSNGIVIITGSVKGNSSNTFWRADDPRWVGPEDYDYISSVINQVKSSQNCNDFFIAGLGQGGHMALAYACERPSMIKAAVCMGGFMEALGNMPQAPVPVMVMHGTGDTSSVYAMGRDTVEIWRARNNLLNAAPAVAYLSSPTIPNSVVQSTWAGGKNGTQAAFVSIKDGSHLIPTPTADSGFDAPSAIWAFVSQYLTAASSDVNIVSQPQDTTQYAGQPATFSVTVTGQGPFSYRWQRNGSEVIGAATSRYTTPLLTAADNGASYSVVVMSATSAQTSSTAALTVVAPPVGPAITASPVSRTVVAGRPVTFSVATTASGFPQYQWVRDGMPIQGAISASYTIPKTVPGDSGACIRAMITDVSGTTTSAGATLTVTPAPRAPVIITNPVRLVAEYNRTAAFTVNAWSGVMPMTYQWQKGSLVTQNSNFIDIAGATDSSYTPPPSSGNLSLPYRCIVTNGFGSVASGVEYQSQSASQKAPAFFYGPATVAGQKGVPFSYTIKQRGASAPIPTVTFDASPLPPGLSVDHLTGIISGTPTGIGTTRVIVVCYSTVGTLLGRLTMNVSATPPPIAINEWRTASFGASALNVDIAGDAADPDNDGHANLLEYATGTNPLFLNLWSTGPTIVGGYLTQSIAKNPTATGIAWGAEWSPDLRTWNNNVIVLQNTATIYQVRDKVLCNSCARRFLRINATLTGGGGL